MSLTDEPRGRVEGFAKQMNMIYPVGMASRSSRDYGVTGIPSAFVVSPDGNILWSGHPMGGLDQAIERALRTNPPVLLDPKLKAKVVSLLEAADGALARDDFAAAAESIADANRLDSKGVIGWRRLPSRSSAATRN